MKPEIERIATRPEAIQAFCRRWKIGELCLFCSVLRDDFDPESDIDVLVKFEPDHTPGLLGIVRMEQEMEEKFGRKVNLVTRNAVERSRNPIRREAILNSAIVVYVTTG